MPFREASTIATDVKSEDPKDYVMKTVATIETGTELIAETEFNTRAETQTETQTETKTATEAEPKMEIGTQVETEMETTTEIEFLTQGSPRMIVICLFKGNFIQICFIFQLNFHCSDHSNTIQTNSKHCRRLENKSFARCPKR